MATLQAADIDDLGKVTINELNRNRLVMMATRFQDHEVTNRLFRRDKVKFESGKEVQWDVMTDHSDSAQMVGLFNVDDVDAPSVVQQITVPWRHTKVDWTYDIREMLMNKGRAKIVSIMKTRHAASMTALAELCETQFFGEPTGTTDKLSVWGLKYWVVSNDSVGHNGGNHTNFSSGPGGLDASVYTRFKNYTGKYTSITRTDLVRKMKTAFRKIHFKTPMGVKDFRRGKGQRYRIYMNDDTIVQFEELAENQNDKLGRDLASMDGVTTFKGVAVKWIPILDDTTSPTNPVYMLDFDSFAPMCLKGNFMAVTGPQQASEQHMVRNTFLDLSWNSFCNDRRRQCVLHTAA